MTKFFTYRDHTVTRGSQIKKIYQSFYRSSIRHNICSIRICKIWNYLLHGVIEASGLNIFKNRLDKHWCKRAFRFHYISDAIALHASVVHASGSGQLQANPHVAGPWLSPSKPTRRAVTTMGSNDLVVIIIIMVIFKCYFSGELIALT